MDTADAALQADIDLLGELLYTTVERHENADLVPLMHFLEHSASAAHEAGDEPDDSRGGDKGGKRRPHLVVEGSEHGRTLTFAACSAAIRTAVESGQ